MSTRPASRSEARLDPLLLWSRALVVGSVALFLGVAGHVTADGLLPAPPVLGALLAFSVLISAPLLTSHASRLRLVTMLVGGQTLVHVALSATGGHAGEPVAAPRSLTPGEGALPVVDGHRVGNLQDAYQGMVGQQETTLALPVGQVTGEVAAHAPMMVAHLTAAALVGLWLAYGERCLWTLLALTGRRIRAVALLLTPTPVEPTAQAVHGLARSTTGPVSRWLVRPDSRRGPPLVA